MVPLCRIWPIKVKSSVRPSVFCFHLSAFGRYKKKPRLNIAKFSLQHGILRSKLAHKSKIVGYREWSNKMSLWADGTFPKWGTNPICYKGKSPFYRAISLGTILVGMKLPVNPATWLWAMIELRCLWTAWILGQKDPRYFLALHWYI